MNVGIRLTETARSNPDGIAVVEPGPARPGQRRDYRQISFRALDDDTDRIAAGLLGMGLRPGMRLALVVRPGIDFIGLVFAVLKAGLIMVLVDPGLGRRNMIRCLADVAPDGFVAIPLAHALRCALAFRFRQARFNVTVGRRWFWAGPTLTELRQTAHDPDVATRVGPDQPAAIIFTSGSTGPPKGVLYRHGNFNCQVDEIRDFYGIRAGEIDVPGFPLFALFNAAMGVTTVVPDMDFTRPARVNPQYFLEAVNDWQATQAFGSPALWNTVGRYCEQTGARMPSLRRALSAGAPVPSHVLRRVKAAMHGEGEMHTPYGATEALPVASISAAEVLNETSPASAQGAGTCVGRRFARMDWRVIRITDEPLHNIDDVVDVPTGEIGELIVRGPVVTRQYVTRTDANAFHKIQDGEDVWHRMGDVGYLDAEDRFWFCGRKTHRVRTVQGTLFTIPCEAIFNQHPSVYRSALVGVGEPGSQCPVVIVEPWPERRPRGRLEDQRLIDQLAQLAANHPLTQSIRHFYTLEALPVDIRHNSKIYREKLAIWAEKRVRHPAP